MAAHINTPPVLYNRNDSAHDKTYKMTFAPSENSSAWASGMRSMGS